MKLKILKIILLCLIAAILVVGVLIIIQYGSMFKNNRAVKDAMDSITQQFDNAVNNTNSNTNAGSGAPVTVEATYKGYNVVGIIEIPKINLKYPVLDTTNQTTLGLSITKFWGDSLNEIGNVVLAGHNYINNIFFGGLKKLQVGDIIYITDTQGIKIEYKVYKTFVIDPDDISVIKPDQAGDRELTLLTCTNGRANRLVVKAREVNV